MRILWLPVLAGGLIGWRWKQRNGVKIGRWEGALGLVGVTTLLLGVSFVNGAVREDEPAAAATASKLFGATGVALTVVAGIVTWRHNCERYRA